VFLGPAEDGGGLQIKGWVLLCTGECYFTCRVLISLSFYMP